MTGSNARVALHANVTPLREVSLNVLKGEQAGARMRLNVGRTYTVGTTLDHDIVLREPAVGSLQIAILDDCIQVVKLESKLDSKNNSSNTLPNLSNEAIENSTSAYGDAIAFGDARFSVEAIATNSDSVNSAKHLLVPTKILRIGGGAVLGFALLGSVLTLTQTKQSGAQLATALSLETRMYNAGLPAMKVERDNGNIILKGYVATRDTLIQIDEFIAKQPENLISRVLADEEIKGHIEDVMSVSGVEGAVESTGQGAFVARTEIGSVEKLKRLKMAIETDVPSISSFELINTIPTVDVASAPAATIELSDGKRVVMVNSERPAYVVTQDQSRYFVGSTLPGGYRIASIADGRVTVEKQGVKTELKF